MKMLNVRVKAESTNAQNVINNGDATDQQIAAEKTKSRKKNIMA